ncbi:hypothetical protein [Streptomyces sp. NPDC001978]|uniref:hypothetical protein n=1 Tax=Streptomyces sp. NPDC001978 TaxID=3364627 RepID=UPI0036A9E27F
MTTDRREQIKRRLRRLRRSLGQPGAAEEAQRLMGEYKRLERAPEPEPADRPGREPEPTHPPGGWPAEQVAKLPAELRARLRRSAMSRVIDRRTLDDPGGWGEKNDARRRR